MARCWQRLTNMNRTQWLANSKQKRKKHTELEREGGEQTRTHYGLAISISLENLWIIFSIEFGWIHNSNNSNSSRPNFVSFSMRLAHFALCQATLYARFMFDFYEYIKRTQTHKHKHWITRLNWTWHKHTREYRFKGIRYPSMTRLNSFFSFFFRGYRENHIQTWNHV